MCDIAGRREHRNLTSFALGHATVPRRLEPGLARPPNVWPMKIGYTCVSKKTHGKQCSTTSRWASEREQVYTHVHGPVKWMDESTAAKADPSTLAELDIHAVTLHVTRSRRIAGVAYKLGGGSSMRAALPSRADRAGVTGATAHPQPALR